MTEPDVGAPTHDPPAGQPPRARTFLGRLTQAVRRQDWFAVALEVVIVVAGVLIALAANDWAAARQAQRVETESLRELRSALSNDLATIRALLDYHTGATVSAQLLREHLRVGGPYTDSLDAHFGRVLGATSGAFVDDAAYETLKQRGLETIGDDSLRVAIGRLYGVTYPLLTNYQDFSLRFLEQQQIPFYNVHFADTRFAVTATPVDYDALATSTEFASILDWLVVNNTIIVERLLGLESDVMGLIEQLDDILAD